MFRERGILSVAAAFGDALRGVVTFNPSPRSERRIRTAEAMTVGLPHEFRARPGMKEKLERLIEEGYGVAGLVPHFSYGDFFRVGSALLLNVRGYSERDILTPIAIHQYEGSLKRKLPLRALEDYTDIRLHSIVTEDTLLRERDKRDQGKKIPWAEKAKDADTTSYLFRAARVIVGSGVVLYAPSTGRRPFLSPFKEEPVRGLDLSLRKVTRRLEIKPRLAHMFFGVEVPGVTDYMAKSKFGMHAGEAYIVTLGLVLTDEELKERATANGRTIDQEAYSIMLELAPLNYRPDQAPEIPGTI